MDAALLVEQPLLALTGLAYAAALTAYVCSFRSTRPAVARAATAMMLLALALNLTLVGTNWRKMGRPPLDSLYGFLLLLALGIAAVHLVLEWAHHTRAFGALAAAAALSALDYAVLRWDAEIAELAPPLRSGWFVPHVVAYLVGYVSLVFGTLVAALQLRRSELRPRAGTIFDGRPLDLDQIGYRALRLGFLLLTIGLLLGAVWSRRAWGDWVWRREEVVSLVAWCIYAGYLHLRRSHRWSARGAAVLAIVSLAVIGLTYLGLAQVPALGSLQLVQR